MGAEHRGERRTSIGRPIHEVDAVLAIHLRRDTIPEELALGPQLADDAHLVHRCNIIERGYGRVVRDYTRDGHSTQTRRKEEQGSTR